MGDILMISDKDAINMNIWNGDDEDDGAMMDTSFKDDDGGGAHDNG